MQLLISVDTEADNLWTVDSYTALSTRNIERLPQFHAVCAERGFAVTYLLSNEVLLGGEFERAFARILPSGGVEWGTHLHPDLCGSPLAPKGRPGRMLASEIPLPLYETLLRHLTEEIAKFVGTRPTSYRAGRFAICAEHLPVLERLGYKVDSSITPNCSWRGLEGEYGPTHGMDFLKAPSAPYQLDRNDVLRSGQSPLLEIPLTILFPRHEWLGRRMASRFRGRTGKHLAQFAGIAPLWFRPLPYYTATDLIAVYEAAKRQQLPCVNLMLHSSELLAGASPYRRTVRAVEELYRTVGTVLDHAKKDGAESSTLTGYANRAINRERGTFQTAALGQ